MRSKRSGADDFAAEVAALKRQLAQLAASIEATAKSEGGEAVKAIGERARDFLSQATAFVEGASRDARDIATETAHAAVANVRATAHEGTERLEDAIRQRPLTAVAIAMGVGCLLSLMLHRR